MARKQPFPKSLLLFVAAVLAVPQLQAQQPLLSPRDSTEIRFNGKRIFIDYGRPSIRGRKIFGGLVPFNKWWRTGANEATSFVTEADIMLGDSLVRAGAYTLYTLPSQKRWQLIVNRQTGQWGTIYNPEYDLYRLPMTGRTLPAVVDTFTIIFTRTARSAGMIHLRWEKTEVRIPFRLVNGSARVGKE